MTIRIERVTTALLAMVATATGVPVGDHGTSGISTAGMYVTGWKIDGGGHSGSLGDGHQDLTLIYQFDSVGRSRNQCEGLADKVRAVMVGVAPSGGHVHQLAGAGWKGGLREQAGGTGMPTPEGTDETGREVWTLRERFEVTVYRA